MRNLYLLTALLVCSFLSHGQQLQNANWCFGDGAGLSFNTSTPTGFASSMNTMEASATVSDQDGNLLFYSNGVTVWNKNHVPMTNGTGLLGSPTSAQGAVIIPKPESKRYYLAYIYGSSGTSQTKGLYYSEIDMDASSGLGAVVSSNKNTPLRDHNNIAIDNNYLIPYPDGMFKLKSEQLTAAKHCNGKDYWLLTQINDKIYVYLVDAAGIGPTPTTVTTAPLPNTPYNYIKVSPNGERIGICVFNFYDEPNSGGVLMGDFNNATGEITLDSSTITIPTDIDGYSTMYYGLEFSPSSQYVYISMGDYSMGQSIYRGDAYNTSTFTQIPGVTNYPYTAIGLQLAMDGKIYVSNGTSTQNKISIIADPDNPIDPDYQDMVYTLPYGLTKTGFPQLVHWHDPQCQSFNVLTSPETYLLAYTHAYSDYIITESGYSVSDRQNITLEAGNYILMEPNTTIDSGSNFLAHIQECGLCETPSQNRVNLTKKTGINNNLNKFIAYPNPTNSSITVQFEGTVSSFTIHDVTGKQLMTVQGNSNGEVQLDLSNLAKGVYMLSANGMPVEKIIKN